MTLEPRRLTWAALLGRWMEFARSALALPTDATGQRLRRSVVDIITLQALAHALEHLDELDADERALGLDRAQILIERHAAALEARWKEPGLPAQVGQLIRDARAALGTARLNE